MTDFSTVKENLEAKGFRVSTFETAQAAADYLNGAIDGVSVAEADHVKGTATVTLTKDVPTEVLKKAIEDKDYKVIG